MSGLTGQQGRFLKSWLTLLPESQHWMVLTPSFFQESCYNPQLSDHHGEDPGEGVHVLQLEQQQQQCLV